VWGRADGIRKAIAGGLSSTGSAVLTGGSSRSHVQSRIRDQVRFPCGKTSAIGTILREAVHVTVVP